MEWIRTENKKENFAADRAAEKLVGLVRAFPEEEYNRVINEQKDWDVLYHLSHIRANLIEWLPISGNDSVLELASGCGALTGTLARKARQVDCVEVSERKNQVNAVRSEKRVNVRLFTGTFPAAEPKLDREYDWITMIGIFGGGEEIMGDCRERGDFLRRVKRHLKPGGRAVLALPNRLGLKYFAGCADDGSGLIFEGIEGYRGAGDVRTFSRPELEKLLDEAGFSRREFYYPYPDYRFPMSIYSDAYLPGLGELRANRTNFDQKRLQVFDESEAYDSIVESGLFPQFSNSFLVVMEKEEARG